MRKIAATALLVLLTITTQAQSLTDLLKAFAAPEPTAKPVENTELPITTKAMVGVWTYSNLAVDLADNSPLKGAFGSVAISQVESILNNLSVSYGFTTGVFSLTILNDKLLGVEFTNGAKATSPYILNTEQKSLSVNIDKIEEAEIGTLTAKVTLKEGELTLLYDAKRLMVIADKIPSIAENSQYQMARGIVGSVEGVMIGFKFTRP